jgi:protein-L-isoaspartate(D-aspartate) O-methyltransferase
VGGSVPNQGIYERERKRMIEKQIKGRGVQDARVLQALDDVPRHLFVPPERRHLAYADGPLPIGEDQTISQPYIVAFMTELLELGGDERVLEIGTGSGYQTAILAHLAKEVYSLERIEALAVRARQTLDDVGITNVEIHVGDGSAGLPRFAPYNRILVTAAAPSVPQPLQDQLAHGGRLVLPVGGRSGQVLERWVREGDGFRAERLAPVAFVPLIGTFAWDESEPPDVWWRSR